MYNDVFIQFLCVNWDLVKKWVPCETLSVFFFLVNLHRKHLSSLSEFSIVDEDTFLSLFGESDYDDHIVNSGTVLYHEKQPKIAMLLATCNAALTEREKGIVLGIIGSENQSDTDCPFLHVFVCKDKYSIVICECCVPLFKRLFSSFAKKTEPKLIDKLTCIAERKDVKLVKEHMYTSKSSISSMSHEGELTCIEDLSIAVSFFLLYVNPYSSENCRNLQSLVATMNRRNLLNCTLFVNNLLKLYPKEADLWDIKCCIVSRWFSKYNARLKSCVISSGFAKILKCSKSHVFSLNLRFIISKFLSDELLKLESKLISEILSIKPFNGSLTNYLKTVYSCICNFICVKLVNNLVNNRGVYHRNDYLKTFRIISIRRKYRTFLSKFIDSYFIKLYYDILREYSFPGLFLLLLDILNDRKCNLTWSKFKSVEISLTSFVESHLNDDIAFLLEFCDRMIQYDVHNCWIYNKSNVFLTILKHLEMQKNADVNEKVHILNVVLGFSFVFSNHLFTWISFIPICDIIFFPTNCYSSSKKNLLERRLANTKRTKFKHEDKNYLREVNCWKSEATFIKNAIESHEFSGDVRTDMSMWYGADTSKQIERKSIDYNRKIDAKCMFGHFTIAQTDKILQAYSQLFLILVQVFKQLANIYEIYNFSLISFLGPLPKTLLMLREYLKLTGSAKSVHFLSGFVENMEKFKRTLWYKYFMLKDGYEREIDAIYTTIDGKELTTISMMLLSFPCRFYLQWDISSNFMLEITCKLISKLIKR